MTFEPSDAQRRALMLAVLSGPQPLERMPAKLRRPLEQAGWVTLEPDPSHPRRKRAAATEAGWSFVVQDLARPFTYNVQLRPLWNLLLPRIAANLAARGEDLYAMIAPEVPQGSDAEGNEERLERLYLDLSGGEHHRRVRIAALRARAGLERAEFDSRLIHLAKEGRVALFPEDDPLGLGPEDHEGAVPLAGIPQHVLYWER